MYLIWNLEYFHNICAVSDKLIEYLLSNYTIRSWLIHSYIGKILSLFLLDLRLFYVTCPSATPTVITLLVKQTKNFGILKANPYVRKCRQFGNEQV